MKAENSTQKLLKFTSQKTQLKLNKIWTFYQHFNEATKTSHIQNIYIFYGQPITDKHRKFQRICNDLSFLSFLFLCLYYMNVFQKLCRLYHLFKLLSKQENCGAYC